MTSTPNLCVVIKIYNEYQMLEECVQSLEKQTFQPEQILIVDDGSPDSGVRKEIERLSLTYSQLTIRFLRMPLKSAPNLDTVGRTFNSAWFEIRKGKNFDYLGTIDADTSLTESYYEVIIGEMERNPELGCVSGAIKILKNGEEYVEQINIGSKFGRRDARGSGKVIRTSLLSTIKDRDFPDIDWDTWINTKAKVRGYKTPQLDHVYMYQKRPTTRVAGKDLYRNGRLTFHFGYNPILLLLKVILAKRGALTFLRGYLDGRRENWRLTDKEVRKYFGWRFFFHF
ncbi:MAG: glycosyltransferase family 2 protein [Candidatus Heimdallarchaeota archaeon]